MRRCQNRRYNGFPGTGSVSAGRTAAMTPPSRRNTAAGRPWPATGAGTAAVAVAWQRVPREPPLPVRKRRSVNRAHTDVRNDMVGLFTGTPTYFRGSVVMVQEGSLARTHGTSPGLPRGRSSLPQSAVRAAQRQRLLAAAVAATAEHGFHAITVA